jgi:hypothetical protein
MANTTSGSYTFDKTFAIDDIIAEAYERIGLVGTILTLLKVLKSIAFIEAVEMVQVQLLLPLMEFTE